jgi:hypothetical protein
MENKSMSKMNKKELYELCKELKIENQTLKAVWKNSNKNIKNIIICEYCKFTCCEEYNNGNSWCARCKTTDALDNTIKDIMLKLN